MYSWRAKDREDDRMIGAAAESGVLIITKSTGSVVEGRFEAVVAEYCRVGTGWPEEFRDCNREPWEVVDGARRMAVEGQFRAVEGSDDVVAKGAPLRHP